MSAYWLCKSEPFKYPFEALVRDKRTSWDGVRNFEARNNLRAMKKGDLALFYHSNEGKAIVGIMRLVREAYPDPSVTAEDPGDWSAVDFEPVAPLPKPVELATIKSDPKLTELSLLKRSRLSVVPVTAIHFRRLCSLGGYRL
jgi:predicted RNA-binding protein with PUA-like domain